jgi:hypothetical protein
VSGRTAVGLTTFTPRIIREGVPSLLPMDNRSPGLHVSEIINRLCVQLGHWVPTEGPNLVKFELGNALEHAVVERYALHDPDRYIRPGELVLDDVYGTPDLLDLYDEAVEECKCTWLSTKHPVDGTKFWHYWVQIKCYCKMMGWSKGRLHVCFVNGNYRRGDDESGPVYRVWEVEFTQEELDKNWAMILKHGRRWQQEGLMGV